ncbi:alpha/beta hydrolase family protein [Bacillus sp. NPDC094077]|uniref:alpha/beta hydrolase family protein n=1 Tax=Bacillus sp. NPDC094077 TaxID=3390932 RepID=UPI003CFC65FE
MLEIIFAVVLLLSSITLIFIQRGVTKKNVFILMINYAFLLATIVVIGANWRMIPAYFLTLILTLQVFLKPKTTVVSKKLAIKVLKSVGIIVTAIAMFTFPLLFPIITLPEPTGKYTVGTKAFHLIDKSRKETAVPSSHGNRELMIQVYYPAEKGSGKPSAYFENIDALAEQLAVTKGAPYIVTTHLGLTKTHSYQDAKPIQAKEKFPLLLFGHGMELYGQQNTFQLEELASQGYVVIALNFTGYAATTIFPNGNRVDSIPIEFTPTALNNMVRKWEQDTSFVLDKVMEGTFDKNFKTIGDLIDYDKIGMLGHSYGGATSAQMLVKDNRIKAAIDMDGGLYGEPMPKDGPQKPFMLMNAEATIHYMKEAENQKTGGIQDELFEISYLRNTTVEKPGVYTVVIPKANHNSFTDLAAFSPIMNEPGEDVAANHKLINKLVTSFFDQTLKGINEKHLEEIQKQHPELHLIKH